MADLTDPRDLVAVRWPAFRNEAAATELRASLPSVEEVGLNVSDLAAEVVHGRRRPSKETR